MRKILIRFGILVIASVMAPCSGLPAGCQTGTATGGARYVVCMPANG